MQYSIFHVNGGIGKNIIGTNVARNIKKKYPERNLVVVSPYPEVFIHNPYIYRVYKTDCCPYFYEDYIKNKDSIVFKLEPYDSNNVIKKECNLANAWCKIFGLDLDTIQPEIYFNEIEKYNSQVLLKQMPNNKPIIALQTNGAAGVYQNNVNFNWFRDLPPTYAINLIKDFGKDFNFVQIKRQDQFEIAGAIQINLSLRELMLFLTQVKGAVCIDSVVQHCMASYGKPSVVCWVNNSSTVFGYNIHKNIQSNLKFDQENLESMYESYPLQTLGHQCPLEYNPDTLFNYEDIKTSFESLYCN